MISKKPSTDGFSAKADSTLGNYGLTKYRVTNNVPVSENIATRFSFSSTERDGFSTNVFTGQDLDDANNTSVRSDCLIDLDDASSLRIFGQYFEVDRNGAAIRGIDDPTPGMRNLSQDTISAHDLSLIHI